MNLRFRIINCALFCILVFSLPVFCQIEPAASLKWIDARVLTVGGKGWSQTAGFYDRLPAKAEKFVRPEIWKLSRNSAGLSISFITDADSISARWKLRSPNPPLSNMTPAAVGGVDLYVKENGKWLWAGIGRPDKSLSNEQKIIGNMLRRKREFLLYLPLYNDVESVQIGVPENAFLSAAAVYRQNFKPVVFYGTSIVQGASASRAGLAYPSILSRKLNRPAINLGFSGNCKMEPEIAELLTEIDAAAYFIDCLPNLSGKAEVEQKAPLFLETLRRKRPQTPIILVENIRYPDVFIEQRKYKIYTEKNRALRSVYRRLLQSGTKNLFYIPSVNLLGNDSEATIDGVHPNDLGFMRMVAVFEPMLNKVLKNY